MSSFGYASRPDSGSESSSARFRRNFLSRSVVLFRRAKSPTASNLRFQSFVLSEFPLCGLSSELISASCAHPKNQTNLMVSTGVFVAVPRGSRRRDATPRGISCFHPQQSTGYFSCSSVPVSDTSPSGPLYSQSIITFVGSDSAQLWRCLFTGISSGVPAGCLQPRATVDGSKFSSKSQCLVTIVLPVELFVLYASSLMGVLVIVCFNTSPGSLSSFVKFVSLCLISACSYALISKFAIWACSNMLHPFVFC